VKARTLGTIAAAAAQGRSPGFRPSPVTAMPPAQSAMKRCFQAWGDWSHENGPVPATATSWRAARAAPRSWSPAND
jgi:hypothetical protein